MNEQKLTEIKADAKINETEAAPFMTPGQAQKRGRGRPRKRDEQKPEIKTENKENSQPIPPIPQIPTAKIVKPLVGVLSRLGEGYVGHPKAAMTPEELDGISEAMGLVLDKWMPTVAGQYGAELMLGVALGQYGLRIVAMRKYLDAEREKEEKLKKAMAQSEEASPRTGNASPLDQPPNYI